LTKNLRERIHLKKPGHRWKNNIKKKLTYKAIVCNGLILPSLALADTVINVRFP
jgi:hypothetical protein